MIVSQLEAAEVGQKQPFQMRRSSGRPCAISLSRLQVRIQIDRMPQGWEQAHAHPFDIDWRAPYAAVTAPNVPIQNRSDSRTESIDGLSTGLHGLAARLLLLISTAQAVTD